jgi:Vam6/Vps39-like protein vacuolar protein sorting-associated protein 39
MEALLEYLTDRRRKVQALTSPPVNQQDMSSLSSLPLQTLLDLSSIPPSQLKPEELTTYAQIVDTALFTVYLVVRPGLIGPFCRIGNFCEVKEVETLLRARDVSDLSEDAT